MAVDKMGVLGMPGPDALVPLRTPALGLLGSRPEALARPQQQVREKLPLLLCRPLQ